MKPREWAKEFVSFIRSEECHPPQRITENIMAVVQNDLNPRPAKVFGKLFLVHAIVGTMTLLVCPQFNFSPFLSGMGLMRIFMVFGEMACTLLCAVIFVSGSVLAASFFMRPEELRIVWKTPVTQVSLLGIFSLALITFMGATVSFTTSLIWLAGFAAAGLMGLKLGWALRFGIYRK